ncbi:MAG TPA: glycosyltransferase [Candidatus Absconditabacterales bacterium]|nr:glycosyltransferase [Candidatus Absconditabacterales bacterium]
MKIAFVHCRISPGGALSVLQDLIDEQKNIDQANIFTLFSDSKEITTQKYTYKVITALPTWANTLFLRCSTHKIPLLSWLFDYRNLMFFYPILMQLLSHKIKKMKPEYIIISSFAIAKNITPISGVPMMLYLHSPMQYIWTHYDEYKAKLKGIKGKLFNRIVPKLRKRDLKYTKFDKVYANSKYTATIAEKLYGIKNIQIKYPRIPNKFFLPAVEETPNEYYVYVGRLVNFVRESDKIIKLCNELKVPLIIMGSGPDEVYLKSIAGPTIIFIGRITDVNEKINIIKQAKGLINLTKESYGIGTVEALLLGVPVFGYNQGATAELVDKDCGILVKDKHHKTLIEEFKKFMNIHRERNLIAKKMREKRKNK